MQHIGKGGLWFQPGEAVHPEVCWWTGAIQHTAGSAANWVANREGPGKSEPFKQSDNFHRHWVLGKNTPFAIWCPPEVREKYYPLITHNEWGEVAP